MGRGEGGGQRVGTVEGLRLRPRTCFEGPRLTAPGRRPGPGGVGRRAPGVPRAASRPSAHTHGRSWAAAVCG